MADAPKLQDIIDAAWAEAGSGTGTGDAAALAACQAETARLQGIINEMLPGPLGTYAWDKTKRGTPVDLTGYVETFRDNFDTMSITRKDGTGPWYAAARSNFGGAAFLQPGDYYDPYKVENGELNITMMKLSATTTPPLPGATATSTAWKTGLIQSVNQKGVGWSQSGGYFEARMKFPSNNLGGLSKMLGAWPAFWLLSVNEFFADKATEIGMEFDVLEAYGSDPSAAHSTVHYKQPKTPVPGVWPTRQYKSLYSALKEIKDATTNTLIWGPTNGNMFDGNYKTYAVKFGEDTTQPTQVFVDGREVGRFPTLSWMLTPVYMLVNLALFTDNNEAANATSPQTMTIDYVLAMKKA